MAVGLALVSCGSGKAGSADSAQTPSPARGAEGKAIVAYFSATGTTKAAAERLAKAAGADLYEITPEQPYTDKDLDWRDSLSRSSVEMKDLSARPAIKKLEEDFNAYEVVYLGYPNWWGTAPTIVYTFLDSQNLKGKKIRPFMTSGGSDIIKSVEDLRKAYPDLDITDGLLMNSVTDRDISAWIDK